MTDNELEQAINDLSLGISFIHDYDQINDLYQINSNYSGLNTIIEQLQNMVDSKYQSMIDYYNLYISDITDAITIYQNASSDWANFYTIVQSNSANWLQPLTLIYPKINNSPFVNSYISEIENWLNAKFPIIDQNTNELLFVENQQAIVSCYLSYSEPKTIINQYLMDQTICVTSQPTICIDCTTNFGGLVGCHQGLFNCTYNSGCPSCAPTHCGFSSPPFIPITSDGLEAYARIEAYVKLTYQDIHEDNNIKTLSFLVQNCKWKFNNYITV